MPRIPEPDIDRIKATIDLGALVRSRGVELKKHGGRDLIGRCPFHEEDTASFVVSPGKGLWHCMGCGAAGNVIQFVEKFDRVSFRHAFEVLADGAGFAAPAERLKSVATVPRLESPIEFAADDAALMGQIADYYHERLMSAATGAPARGYLARRGLDDANTLKRFRVGFADRSLGLRLPHKNRAAGAEIRSRLTRLGIYRESGHEHLNGCVIVPMFAAGNVTGLYGRRIDDGGKSGMKHLYLPGPHVGLFNAEALENEEVILCEALLDALTFAAAGIANATSIYGTEGFTGELMEEMNRRKVRRVKLAYDADEAGERAAARDAEKLRAAGIEVMRIKFPWGMDANEYARKVTPAAQSLRLLANSAAWLGGGAVAAVKAGEAAAPVVASVAPAPSSSLAASLLAADAPEEAAKKESGLIESGDVHTFAVDGREYRLAGLEKNTGVESLRLTLRVRAGERLHSDQIDLCKDGDRRRFVERAAEECALHAEALKRDLGRLLLACEQWQEERLRRLSEPSAPQAAQMGEADRSAALELLQAPDLLSRLDAAMEICGLVGERGNGRAAYLAGVSRKLAKPLAVIVQSTSAAGKTTLMDAVLNFFPEEERIKYSAMTGQSLYYLGDANLKHKILAIVEEEGAEKASYALKLLQSEGELTIASTGKDPNTGRMETQEYHVEGPVMIFLTTTTIDIDDELLNRCMVVERGRVPRADLAHPRAPARRAHARRAAGARGAGGRARAVAQRPAAHPPARGREPVRARAHVHQRAHAHAARPRKIPHAHRLDRAAAPAPAGSEEARSQDRGGQPHGRVHRSGVGRHRNRQRARPGNPRPLARRAAPANPPPAQPHPRTRAQKDGPALQPPGSVREQRMDLRASAGAPGTPRGSGDRRHPRGPQREPHALRAAHRRGRAGIPLADRLDRHGKTQGRAPLRPEP